MPRPRAYKLKGAFGQFTNTKIYVLGFTKQPTFLPDTDRGFAGLCTSSSF